MQNFISIQVVQRRLPCSLEYYTESFNCVTRNGLDLRSLSNELRNYRKIVLAAVKQNGYALRFAEPELQANRKIVLAAVKQNGYALHFASDKLRADRKIVLTAHATRINDHIPPPFYRTGRLNLVFCKLFNVA